MDVETLNGEPYGDEAGLSFFTDSDDLSVAFNDVCSAGAGELRKIGETFHFDFWLPTTIDCPNHPASLFSEPDVELSITLDGGVLTISGPTGQLTATHFQSVSIHDDLVQLPSVATPNIQSPASTDPDDIKRPANLAVPECESLEAEITIDIDAVDSDVFSTMMRLYVVSDELPFVTDVGIREFAPAGIVTVEMSAGYGPTIDWLSENVGSTQLCLFLPPAGGVPDIPPPATTVLIAPTSTLGD